MDQNTPRKKVEIDKSTAGYLLNRRVTGILMKRRKPDAEKVAENRIFFMFDDGSGFEMFCSGQIFPKQIEAYMVAGRLLTLGKERYDDEFVAVSNDKGDGYNVLVNKPFVLK
ncbi:MAG TPA: hypothetical protein VFX02_14070 [Gammaproteobacteria bacterium]|nr:hypothetical protein [Gammaproteobacteria bacterium]